MKEITTEDVKNWKAQLDTQGPRQTSFDDPLPNGYWRVAGMIMTTAQRDLFMKEFIKQGEASLKNKEDESRDIDNNI